MSAVTRNLRHGKIIISDGSPNPKKFIIPIDEGNLTYTEKDPTFIVMNRGKIDSRNQGDETPLDLGFGIKFQQFSYENANNGISVRDALKGVGGASDWVSTDECGPFSVNIEYKLVNPCYPSQYEDLTFKNFHADELVFKEGNEYSTLEVKGQALQGTPDRTYVTP